MQWTSRLDQVISRHKELEDLMASGTVASENFSALSREFSELTPIVEHALLWKASYTELKELEEMLKESDLDSEMKSLVQDEYYDLKNKLPKIENQTKLLLLPKDSDDSKGIILEVRSGTGGDEAALFAGDLYRMYQRYASLNGWRVELLDEGSSEAGGFSHISFSIVGSNVYGRMKYESGVHRVQRVPVTESSGRIHTSAATVAVLPEAKDVDIHIEDKDLRIDTYRSQGAGGQHVNTTDSAIRITHLPTKIVVQCQDEKSQHKNKAKAMKVLRARLYDFEQKKQQVSRDADRKSMVGSGDRSERIRTYNFPQGRVTDHRINLTLYKLEQILSGEGLNEIIEALIIEDQAAKLAELGDE